MKKRLQDQAKSIRNEAIGAVDQRERTCARRIKQGAQYRLNPNRLLGETKEEGVFKLPIRFMLCRKVE